MQFVARTTVVAHCRAVSENVVRVQLPGGVAYASTLRTAAEKTASRTALDGTRAEALSDVVAAAVEALNGGRVATITLELTVHDESVGVRLLGKQAKSGGPPGPAALAHLDKVAAEAGVDVSTTENKASFRIDFEVASDD